MNLLLKRILGASFAFAAFSFVNTTPANAQSCAVAPTCEELGYTDTSDRCDGSSMLRCPFDQTKVLCRIEKYVKPCDAVGDVLLDNLNCAKDKNKIPPTHTAIAVVFDINNRKAVSLDYKSTSWYLGFDYAKSYATAGTNPGDWTFPDKDNMQMIFDNIDIINPVLVLFQQKEISINNWHWSSSEHTSNSGWEFNKGNWHGFYKHNIGEVRTMIQF